MFAKIKEFIELEYKFLIIMLVFLILAVFPLPYYVTIGGGTTRIDDKIIVADEYNSIGSFNITYVEEMKATPLSYLVAKIFDLKIEKVAELKEVNETQEEYEIRQRLLLKESINNSKYVAFTAASQNVKLESTKLRIIYIAEDAKTDLKFNDIILEVNDIKVEDTIFLAEEVNKTFAGDVLKIKVQRGNQEIMCSAETIIIDGQEVMGVYIFKDKDYKTDKTVSFKEQKRSSGSSAGLMMSLSIYNKLVEEDITNGLKIAGTGTIDEDGSIGEIGGIEYKLKAAVKNKADVFIAPAGENYQEVVNLVKERKYNIKIIQATTFEQVLNDLKEGK